MNTDRDEDCTCDVGPFATCPACQKKPSHVTVKGRKKFKYETQSAEDRIAEIKAGYR